MKPPIPTDDPTRAPEAGSGAPSPQIVPWRGEHIAALQEAMLDAFDQAELEQLTLIEFNIKLDSLVAVTGTGRTRAPS